MSASVRRSTRSRKVNTKYASVGWNKETLRLLRESSESSNPTSASSDGEPGENDTEFDETRLLADGASPDRIGGSTVESDSPQSGQSDTSEDDADENGGQNEDGDGDEDESDDGAVTAKNTKKERTRKPKSRSTQPSRVHSRGILPTDRSGSIRAGVWQSLFGPQIDDMKAVLFAKEKWLYTVRDITRPSWTTIAQVASDRRKRLYSLSHLNIDGGADADDNDRIAAELKMQQKLRHITLGGARRQHFVIKNCHDHEIVLGPWSRQQAYDLPYLEPVSLGQAWKKDDDTPEASYHSGWLINVGEKPQCMAWSTRTVGGQYIALACRAAPRQRSAVPKVEFNTAPAFSPSASYPMSIQIWRLAQVPESTKESHMNFVSSPRLVQIIAGRFGDVKQMAWAPESVETYEAEKETHLGLLTVLSTDGHIRLIHVPIPDNASEEPVCFEVDTPALQVSSDNGSIFTDFTFASPVDLVVGTSWGHVQVYNLSQPPMTAPDGQLRPYLDHQLHSTYVTSVCCANGDRSHFIASASAAGGIQLTDLRSPLQDRLNIPRARLPSRNLIFSPHCQAFITTTDSSGGTELRGNTQTFVVAHTLRHFYTAKVLTRTIEGHGAVTVLAGSPLHPCVLTGSSNGTVWIQNIARRIFPTGKPGASTDSGAWVQKVVDYEWIPQKQRRDSTNAASSSDGIDFYHGPPIQPGISRMHFGFNLEKLDLSNAGSKKQKGSEKNDTLQAGAQLIFAEERAVTCMEWSQSDLVAGWCAIGWGSGVVLITDLGHEAV